ncbi:hypothetical protein EMCG_06636 [[Emmonsia] crescens]|uniref:Uncharacterized protein n=1 Tax=[Emmonsia] crescens TaxID=73230 RepID=A0A0G2JBL4_9EURO|nr:hypothetical protein EMCG_06636 [Emmonsia crescens UAMH 3008]
MQNILFKMKKSEKIQFKKLYLQKFYLKKIRNEKNLFFIIFQLISSIMKKTC